MDGKTTFISRGAEIGASRGLLLVNSAGNDGNNSWKYIGAPADAPSVITVGAVDSSGSIASFSSFGPTSDGRIKPEILSKGQSAAILKYDTDSPATSNGTSFSSPIMAGLIACLNQFENPLLKTTVINKIETQKNKNEYLKKAIYKSADKYSSPTDQYGYGIPNFEIAYNSYFVSTASVEENILESINVYPNPILTNG